MAWQEALTQDAVNSAKRIGGEKFVDDAVPDAPRILSQGFSKLPGS